SLLERTEPLLDESWTQFCRSLLASQSPARLHAYERLTEMIGDDATEQLLRNFVHHRADWWCFAEHTPQAVARACAPMRARLAALAGRDDCHPAHLLLDRSIEQSLLQMLQSWRSATGAGKVLLEMASKLEGWLAACPSDPDQRLDRLAEIFLTKEGTVRNALDPNVLGKKLAPGTQPFYHELHARILDCLRKVHSAREEWEALELTLHGLECGQALLKSFQQRKAHAGSVDFTDLEWHAHRLLSDPDVAAYMQCWLDARYRHLLLDEFQDTNPLQWQVLQSWLASYEADARRPTVFLVGDPKQSIYRFRGAEPRVFDVAREQLARDFGAVCLRTNVTRRNAPELVQVFNSVFAAANPLYQDQSTRVAPGATGAGFLLLPRVVRSAQAAAGGDALRDALTDARNERVRDERYREGLQLASCIKACLSQVSIEDEGQPRTACWSDVAILVRRRTHLADLERALRDSAVPFLSARRGSLLRQLEVEDLVALLAFVCDPTDDLQLARALRSPMFDCDEDDLMALAQAPGASWWERLLALKNVGEALRRARELLTGWLPKVGILPVHDLLDTIVFESEARARYAAAAPASAGAQVQANIDALLELALALDSGRFPSPMRFVRELQQLRESDESDADEGIAADENAVRLLTIHAAKGLEAPIVVLPDTHFGDWQEDRNDVLLGWLPQEAAPEHFSLVGRVSQLGGARQHWVDLDREQRTQEDWNLLYVAMTRAKQLLIVSGVDSGRAAPGSWYERIASRVAPTMPRTVPTRPELVGATPVASGDRAYRDFRPAPIATGNHIAEQATEAMRIGSAWHALLQRMDAALGQRPTLEQLSRSFLLSRERAAQVIQAAQRVRTAPELERFFRPGVRADNELELIDQEGRVLRIDRLVELDDACWILDYKWQLADDAMAGFRAQLRRYALALAQAGVHKRVRMMLIASDASAVEVPAMEP
ncbi:MAG TPA: UvrD-helicase domain-containing protein, partial [Burkholderiaceae bacterium]|nr:UvrD-helicase domain-containing protein [Burkholderiaceae bacterium]